MSISLYAFKGWRRHRFVEFGGESMMPIEDFMKLDIISQLWILYDCGDSNVRATKEAILNRHQLKIEFKESNKE